MTDEQLNNLDKEALVIIVFSLHSQLGFMQEQLNTANEQLANTNRQIELLTEQIRIMNLRQFCNNLKLLLKSRESCLFLTVSTKLKLQLR